MTPGQVPWLAAGVVAVLIHLAFAVGFASNYWAASVYDNNFKAYMARTHQCLAAAVASLALAVFCFVKHYRRRARP